MKSRSLTPADADAVARLWLAGAQESAVADPAFFPRISAADYSRSLAHDFASDSILGWGVFDESGSLLGYLTARLSATSPEFAPTEFLYLLDLDVEAQARRRGIGAALVNNARCFAAERGLTSIEVSWLQADPRATAFWRAQGFTPYLARARVPVAEGGVRRDDL